MKFLEFEEEARLFIAAALSKLGLPPVDVDVGRPSNPTFGDLSSSTPLKLAKELKLKPGELALKIAAEIMSHDVDYRYIGAVSAHQAGYLNFTLNLQRFAHDSIEEALSAGPIGTSELGRGKLVSVEHTSVNPNKALHIGHARNLVLGDSIARVMRHLGYRVHVLNYIDDSGAQVAPVIIGFKFLGISDKPHKETKFDSYCGDNVYVRVTKLLESDPSLKERQSQVLQEIEGGEGEIAAYAAEIVDRILKAQLETCWRLGAAYDLLNWESQIVHSGMWAGVFEKMKAAGLVHLETEGENKGCWVIADPDTGEQKVLVRSDDTSVYVAKDIPYAAWKVGLIEDPFEYSVYVAEQPTDGPLWTTGTGRPREHPRFAGADLAITVIDTKQSYLQRIVRRVLDQLQEGSAKRYLHRSYEVVTLSKNTAKALGFQLEGEFAHLSGRKGLYVNADTMLDTLKEKAQGETRKRNLQESQEWVDSTAEALAVAALRYELIRQDPDKMINFDMADSLKFEGDTGPYLLYTYARARRILAKSSGVEKVGPGVAKLSKPQEKALVVKMSMLDKAVLSAGEYLSPKEVATYAHELALLFNEFYENVPVNQEEDDELRRARLALVEATSNVLAQAMGLIGIPTRDRI